MKKTSTSDVERCRGNDSLGWRCHSATDFGKRT